MEPILNFINGEFHPSASGMTLETVNPASGQVITTLPRSSAEDVATATKAALEAGPAWSATTMEERMVWLHHA